MIYVQLNINISRCANEHVLLSKDFFEDIFSAVELRKLKKRKFLSKCISQSEFSFINTLIHKLIIKVFVYDFRIDFLS